MQVLTALLLGLLLTACARTAGGATSPPAATATTGAIDSVRPFTTAAPAILLPARPEATPTPPGLSAPCATGPHAVIRRQGVGGETLLNLEVARTPAERARGLMERTELDENAGMVFVYDAPQPLVFWMRNTLIPLSIAFVAPTGEIVDIQDMQPLDETYHYSAAPAMYAVEVNQGYFDRRGIAVGDTFEFRLDSAGDCEAASRAPDHDSALRR